ncbi:MAG: cysteine desulfurase family protein, partial [Candidatus Izemoplasmataceae bacterium]
MPYFDYAATTKIDKTVLKAMQKTMETYYGNPSSLHDPGIQARKRLNQVKNEIGSLLNATRKELIFTSSGTEATNLAIKGVYYKNPTAQIITSKIEHHATENTLKFIERLGGSVHWLEVNEEGFIDFDKLEKALKKETSLVSIIFANNEIGTLQNVKKIRAITKAHNVLLHLDMVQAPLHMPIDFHDIDADLVSLSAHKFNGPRGIGLLYKKENIILEPLIHGGQQEFSMRAGTENLAAIVGFSEALKLSMKRLKTHQNHIDHLAHYFIEQLNINNIAYRLNGPDLDFSRLNNILNIGFKNQDAQTLSFKLNQNDIYVSL